MTDFMGRLLDSVASAESPWLADRQEAGRTAWAEARIPTRKTEAWKYTSVHALDQDFGTAPSAADAEVDLPALGSTRLVFVDGIYRAEFSTVELPAGAELVPFSEASDEQAERIQQHLGSAVDSDKHMFARLNDAGLANGLFLHVTSNTIMDDGIHLVWLTTSADTSFSINQRLLVVMGANSQASLVEHFTSTDGGTAAFTNGITELVLGDGARLNHYRLQLEQGAAMHIGGVHARLSRDSLLNSFNLALGSELKRIDIVVDHQGPGAHCELNGVYLLRGSEHVDYHSCVEHSVPHCTTDEVFRGIIGDEASAVFNGRIHIHPDAQKTRAELSNKNLLTSDRAEINTKPELEIYADDVQCAHGATVAQLDPEMLHYLRTRGVPREEAEVILSYGFINELIEDLDNEALRDYLKPLLADRFSRDPKLTRHLA
jgi:Fe-S cluster assembly protein SufD